MSSEKFSPDKYYVMHGCPPTEAMVTPNEKRWMVWLADELKKLGFDAVATDLPTSWNPKYLEWKAVFEKEYPVTEKTVVVAHSCSGAFIVRWLLEKGLKIHKLVLVAPAKVSETPDDTRKDLYDFKLPEDGSHIADEIVLFISNDAAHHLESRKLYEESLHPRVVELEGKGHFLFYQMNTNQFPELLDEVLK